MLDVDERQGGIDQVSLLCQAKIRQKAKKEERKNSASPQKLTVAIQSNLRPSIHLDSDDSNRAGSTPQRRTLIFPLDGLEEIPSKDAIFRDIPMLGRTRESDSLTTCQPSVAPKDKDKMAFD
ncbi:uncharacterized protein NECHADRAFT_75676 [Fusarium vanettenii 77-13-4]|uniref:Uncharacterized protein n=1 Tax=Fusarium vanettenii (strain ATCC MYA-4622 / CBS 123669 / FGSC 9596 / NRRL 45880 / 77-13-4) TaxID=660122 RepID=C7YJH1_FUSV7|nr:uncharacterized protein NECHADRAFT_75676 [Fusarium vanettenii 77-13-4]EEU48277.1 predicted protein [Fusarium vanettenii 77-13-4]